MHHKKEYDIILIDLDGTLTDSRPGVFAAVRYALDRMDLPIPSDTVLNEFIGPPLLDSFEKHCGLTGEDGQRALKEYRVYYTSGGEFENSVYDGVEDMLKALQTAGKKLVVCTSKPEEMAVRIMEHFGLAPYFAYICGASMDETRNDKPAVIRYALERCGIPVQDETGDYGPEDLDRVVLIGDRMYDAEGAAEIGIDCIGVLYGYGSRDELEEAGATHIAQTPADVAGIIMNKSFEQ